MDDTDKARNTGRSLDDLPSTVEAQAAAWFLRRRQRRLDSEESAALQDWLAESPEHAQVWRETERTWQHFDHHATLPELVVAREQALASVRQTQSKRWAKAASGERSRLFQFLLRPVWLSAVAAVVVAAVILWQLGTLGGGSYRTGIGEQRTVLLPDNSSIALDALTQIRVQYDDNARTIELTEGQAQFDVASDSKRPFRVRVGTRVIEALGTSFTVTYIDKRMRVALLEGRVKVEPLVESRSGSNVGATDASAPLSKAPTRMDSGYASLSTVLNPGDALRVDPDGKQMLDERTDLAVATAWRQGKVVFQQEPLRNAVERLNRYSRVRLDIVDPQIAQWPISGIFGVGDAEAFAEAIASYFPIQAQRSDGNIIELRELK